MERMGLSLPEVISSLEQMARIAEKLIGPTAGKVLMEDQRGGVLVTKDGATIFKSMTLDHPIAKMILDACLAHHTSYGDGSKSILLLIFSGLHYIYVNDLIGKSSNKEQQTSQRQSIILALNWFRSSVFLNQKFKFWITKNLAKKEANTSETDFASARITVKKLLCTYLHTKFSGNASKVLVDIILSLLDKVTHNNLKRLNQSVEFCMKHFDSLFVTTTGSQISSSRIVNGLLLCRSTYISNTPNAPMDGRAIFVMWDDLFKTETSAVFESENSNDHMSLLSFPIKQVKKWLDCVKENGISILFLQGKPLSSFKSLCDDRNVLLIDCMSVDEISFLKDILKVQVICDITEEIVDKMSVYIYITELQIGNDIYLNVTSPVFPDVYSVLIASPSPGLCSQYKNSIFNVMLLLQHWIGDHSFVECENFCSVEGKGNFFLKIHRIINDTELLQTILMKSWSEENEKNKFIMAVQIVSRMLLEIPKAIHGNDISVKDQSNRFISIIKHNSNRDEETNVIHPISNQLALICNSLSSIEEVLKIDSILSVKSNQIASLDNK